MQLGLNLGVQFFFQSLVEVLEEVQPSADNKTSCGAFGVLWATIPYVSQQKKKTIGHQLACEKKVSKLWRSTTYSIPFTYDLALYAPSSKKTM